VLAKKSWSLAKYRVSSAKSRWSLAKSNTALAKSHSERPNLTSWKEFSRSVPADSGHDSNGRCKMQKFMVFLSLCMMFLIGGCNGNQGGNHGNEEAYDLKNDRSAPNYMSNRDGNTPANMSNRGENKQRMVEDDITNQNPNFLNLKRTGSGSETGGGKDTGEDISKAKQVIADSNEFTVDSVWINGDRMWVSVYKKGMQSEQGKVKAEARLHRKLIQALPRYKIEVRVKEDRR